MGGGHESLGEKNQIKKIEKMSRRKESKKRKKDETDRRTERQRKGGKWDREGSEGARKRERGGGVTEGWSERLSISVLSLLMYFSAIAYS